MNPKLLPLLVATCALPTVSAVAQNDQGPPPAAVQPAEGAAARAARPIAPVTIKQLRDNVYAALGGAGGVSGVVVGDKGVIVIDAKQTPDSATQTIARIGEITPKPVTTIILTGNGGEGVPGLEAYPAGLKIIAHADTQKALERLAAENARNRAPADKMPNVLIKDDRKLLNLEGIRMVFLHIAPSHTLGESSVYLPDQRIVFTGYVAQARPDFPVIHPDQDGSATGWLKFMKALINLDADIYVLGPGDIWTKAQMEQRLAAQQAVYEQIKSMVAAGKSRDEVRIALHTGLNGRYPNFMFSEVAYDEISKNAAPQH
jgi:glyoxylase-like metal-dependent hydrolase (beta-lactamase superfamily II)